MKLHKHILKGCAPAPLSNYLKALGILRLLVEQQADPQARGWWEGERFCLLSRLSCEEIELFFLEKYQPTPLLSPWNKGCGFFQENDPGLAPLEQSTASRFQPFRNAVKQARSLLDALSVADAVVRAIKDRTKTNKSFQSEKQRQLLEHSEAYTSFIQKLQAEAEDENSSHDKREQARQELATAQSLVTKRSSFPQKNEVEPLKASSAYKGLLALAERRFKSLKSSLVPDCRREWRGPHAEWLAAAVVIDDQGDMKFPSLLGTGGNDGRLDFTNNFMQQLGKLFAMDSAAGIARPGTDLLLAHALWEQPAENLSSAAIGQYQPGTAGGANSSTGFDGGNLVNGWDFVLMLEGTILFSCQATRRFATEQSAQASAPFGVHSHGTGFASPGTENAQRGEQWMPLWRHPATLAEIRSLFGEARIQLDRKTADRPVDVARAIARLGVARGIAAFTRYGYLERNGQSTLAVPLGRIVVRPQPESYLIDDMAQWLDRFQRQARDSLAPARLVQAERRLADAVFAALTHDSTPERWQTVLRAAVAVEALQAAGTAFEAGPIPPLRPEWVASVNDGSAEIRLALALGCAAGRYSQDGRPSDPVRHHWLPLERGGRRFQVLDKRLAHDPRVVMTGRDPLTDFAAVVQRRVIEAGREGKRRLPLTPRAGCGARLDDLAAFLNGRLDLSKLYDLARAFMALKWDQWSLDFAPKVDSTGSYPEESWLALRLACLPWPLSEGQDIPTEPTLLGRLRAGDSTGAVQLASRRLQAAGIRPPLQAGVADPYTTRLWAAALVFPIHRSTAQRAAQLLDPAFERTAHV